MSNVFFRASDAIVHCSLLIILHQRKRYASRGGELIRAYIFLELMILQRQSRLQTTNHDD